MPSGLTVGKFRFTETGLEVRGHPTVEEWEVPLQFALWCQRASPWWIGDMLNSGDAHFGEMFSQVCNGPVSADQLQRYESVARRVPPENRRATLSWSCHAAVARLPVEPSWDQWAGRSPTRTARPRRRARLDQHGPAAEGPRGTPAPAVAEYCYCADSFLPPAVARLNAARNNSAIASAPRRVGSICRQRYSFSWPRNAR